VDLSIKSATKKEKLKKESTNGEKIRKLTKFQKARKKC